MSHLGKLNEVIAVKARTKTQSQQGWGVNYPTHCGQMVRMHFFQNYEKVLSITDHTRANLFHHLGKLYYVFRNILNVHLASCLM